MCLSNMDIFFMGKVNKGKITFDTPDEFSKHLWSLEGKVIQTIVRKYKTSRTNPQNKLYWFYLTFIAHELGYETEELHATFKAMFLTDRSSKFPIVKSTTSLTTTGFTNYIDKIVRKMAEMDIILPDPKEIDL